MSNARKKLFILTITLTLILSSVLFLTNYIIAQTKNVEPNPLPVTKVTIQNCVQNPSLQECAINFLKKTLKEDGVIAARDNLIQAVKQEKAFLPQCHTILHQVGKDAWATYKEKAFIADIYDCDFAYYHGMFPESAKELGLANFTAIAQPFCNQIKNPAMLSSCYHGLGHAMRYAGESLQNSSISCQKAPTIEYSDDCMRGVVMEEYTLQNPSPTTETSTLLNQCRSLSNSHQKMCIFDMIRMDLATFPDKTEKVAQTCQEDPIDPVWCQRGLGAGIAQSVILPEDASKSAEKINKLCSKNTDCSSSYGTTLVMVTRSENTSLATCQKLTKPLIPACESSAKQQAIAQKNQGGFALDAEKSSTLR
jgi:hypothetical protein